MSYKITEFKINNTSTYLCGRDMTLNEYINSEHPATCKSVNVKITESMNKISGGYWFSRYAIDSAGSNFTVQVSIKANIYYRVTITHSGTKLSTVKLYGVRADGSTVLLGSRWNIGTIDLFTREAFNTIKIDYYKDNESYTNIGFEIIPISNFHYLYPEKYEMNKYSLYVSSSQGSDETGNGTIDSPYKTINYAIGNKPHSNITEIRLKNGDVFYEKFNLINMNINSYGIGKKPIISGYKKIKNDYITVYSDNIYSVDLSNTYAFDGYSNNTSSCHILDNNSNKLYARLASSIETLTNNFDMFKSGDVFYFYYDGLKDDLNISIASNDKCIVAYQNFKIKNISIEGFLHGIQILNCPCEIDNCVIRNCGGNGPEGGAGNGIELYADKYYDNISIQNCIIENIYDAGFTIQTWDKSSLGRVYNLIFKNNKVINTLWGVEFDINGTYTNNLYNNVIIENNYIVSLGKYVFNLSEREALHYGIYSMQYIGDSPSLPIIRNNTFVGCGLICATPLGFANTLSGNRVFIPYGKKLYDSHNDFDEETVLTESVENNDIIIEQYRNKIDDYTSRIYALSDDYMLDKLYLYGILN